MDVAKAPSQSREDAVSILAKLLDMARVEVKMSTAFTRDSYAGPILRPAIERALAALPDPGRGVPRPFKVLLDYGVSDSKAAPYLPWWLSHPKVEVRRSTQPILHMMIVDRSSFRIEEPHLADVELRSNVRAFNALPSLAEPVNRMFNDLFDHGIIVESFDTGVKGGVDLATLKQQPMYRVGTSKYVLDRISLEPPGTRCIFVRKDSKGRLERSVSLDSGLVELLPSGEVNIRLSPDRIKELFG
jgi:hypothetical protein